MGMDDYKNWHCDFIQLAWDSGFSFGKYQYPSVDRYKICLVDIERIIRERDVAAVEHQIPTILQFILEDDQANVLDQNFVKVFRISQLSVEYLLFCKKYLDNLVISMKKEILGLKQETKELRSYVEELETHLSAVTTNNLISTFRCDKCPKVFSSESYLTSHFKRRHDEENEMKKNLESEKLYSEIRELRERLNVAERTMKDKTDEPESEKLRIEESPSSKFIDEIQKQIVKFKDEFEYKIENLQSEKEFFSEKYDKLFDVLLHYKNKENHEEQKIQEGENKYDKGSPEKIEVTEHTTQTENSNISSNLRIQSMDKETITSKTITANEDHEKNNIIDQKINALGENIETKISSGLSNIQNQMETLCDKLSQFEANQVKLEETTKNLQISTIQKKGNIESKPIIKPRTKFSKPTTLVTSGIEAEKLKLELNKMLSHRVESQKNIMEPKSKYTSESESETDSIKLVQKETSIQKVQPKTTKVSLKKSDVQVKNRNASSMNITAAEIEKKNEQVKNEINDALHIRLQEIGISPHRKGIPKKTFQRAMDIVRHQASLNNKYFSDYDELKKAIENLLKHENESETKISLTSSKHKRYRKEPNLIKIGYRKTNKEGFKSKPSDIRPLVEIKNRSMYDTDSEIEQLEKNLPSMGIENIQKAVIEELRVVQSQSMHLKSEDTDSDVKSLMLSDEEDKVETKSAMKTYPSEGSLVKKKVLFNMKQIEKKSGSVAGQVIDKEITIKTVESSVSDFEIS